MSALDVRIEKMEPMRVASVRVISENPEQDAWEKLKLWAEANEYLGNTEEHPVFGFNNPNPSQDQTDYGYEFWMRVPPNTESEGEIEMKDFPGGFYAVITHDGLPNPEVWMSLWNWVQSSSHEYRKTNELEKPHDPLASLDKMTFDLYLPIVK